MAITIGTSGYSYDDWIGPFYPEGTKKDEFLSYYVQHFDTNELNFTYYRMPSAKMLANFVDKAPKGFLWSVKAPSEITHKREDPAPNVQKFNDALQPMKDAKQLACALLQFPSSFRSNKENADYLKRLRDGFGDTPLVVEFRNREWITEDTFDLLHEHGMGFCCVDQPQFKTLLPPIAIATSPVAYVRFHGRNYKKWWHHDDPAERYDYDYSAEELQEWAPRIQALDEQKETSITVVYMNNHSAGKAPADAKELAGLLKQAGANVVSPKVDD